jgi:GR25 family glycosyltransferase involved in LPS biosynthesis
MDQIQKIIYINLDHRQDRRQEFEAEIRRLGIPESKVVRFSAYKLQSSLAGCSLSHAKALRLAHSMNLENVLLCEDDFNFHDDPAVVESNLQQFFQKVREENLEWDVVQLAYNIYNVEPKDDLLSIAQKVSNAAGYLVNRHMMIPLADAIEAVVDKLAATGHHWLYSNDVVWCQFMEKKHWYIFNTRIGYQRPSYSDLGQMYVKVRR